MVYGMDLKMPGMLNAAVKDCPVFGGKVKSFDAARVSGMRGVKKVVQVGDSGVAVIADTWWNAKSALEQLPVVWDEGANAKVSSADIAEVLKAGLDAEQAFVGNQAGGDVKTVLAGAAKRIEAVYAYPFQNHACMEPMNATVRYTPDKCELWGPTQNGEGAFAQVLEASGLAADKVDVHNVMLGGGFGRRGTYPDDYVRQAVLIAKQMPGTPVKMIWSREEDMAHGRYHPVMQCKLVGGLDAGGNLTALHMRLSGQSILAAVRPEVVQAQKGRDPLSFQGVFESGEHSFSYTVPNLLIDHAMRNTHVPPGFWRGVNINQHAVNPAQIERQVAGSFVYGLSALFFQECTVKDGRIEQTNFHQYNSMRIAQMPKVETILMPTGGTVWGGIGEPTICVAAPAVMNAFYRATGKRIRSVPLKNHGIELA